MIKFIFIIIKKIMKNQNQNLKFLYYLFKKQIKLEILSFK
jgi:hypothetical protein